MHITRIGSWEISLVVLYLIVPLWYASVACQATLIEPWFVIKNTHSETKRGCRVPPKRTKNGTIRCVSQDIKTAGTASDWLIANLGTISSRKSDR